MYPSLPWKNPPKGSIVGGAKEICYAGFP